MDSLPDQGFLKFHPNTLTYIRSQYNLDKPGEMDRAIDALDAWLKKQNHFTVKSFPRNYLERQIILDKGSVERAKNQIEKLFTMKTIVTNFHGKYDVKQDFETLREVYIQALLPKLTKDHYRIYAGRVISNKFEANSLTQAYCHGMNELEYVRAYEYCNGFVTILDYRMINIIDLIAILNLNELRQLIGYIMEGYQMRLKGLHFLTHSKMIDSVVKILRQIFSSKIGNRIYVHTTLESLHEHVSKDCLPEEFGGSQKSLLKLNAEYTDELSRKEHVEYFKEMSNTVVDESLRVGDKISKDDILGISGSFRTISVD